MTAYEVAISGLQTIIDMEENKKKNGIGHDSIILGVAITKLETAKTQFELEK